MYVYFGGRAYLTNNGMRIVWKFFFKVTERKITKERKQLRKKERKGSIKKKTTMKGLKRRKERKKRERSDKGE